MTLRMLSIAGVAAVLFAANVANAQDTIKIGVIMPYSGIFSDTSTQMDGGLKLYLEQHGDTVAGKKIEIIRKDVGGINPAVAKRLAQELVVRDHVNILAGFVLTPNAIAAAEVSKEAKVPLVIMNAATSIITLKSPYSVRVSMTLPQITAPFGAWAVKHGIKSVYTMVADYGPGHDAEQGFTGAFKAAGGKVARFGPYAGEHSRLFGIFAKSQGLRRAISVHFRARRPAAGRDLEWHVGARHHAGQDQDTWIRRTDR